MDDRLYVEIIKQVQNRISHITESKIVMTTAGRDMGFSPCYLSFSELSGHITIDESKLVLMLKHFGVSPSGYYYQLPCTHEFALADPQFIDNVALLVAKLVVSGTMLSERCE